MKKNIGFVPMDSSLAAWLLEKLTKEPPVSDSTEELRSGIQDMLRGEINSLLLSAAGETELPPQPHRRGCVSVSWRSTPKVDGSSQRAGRSV